MPDRMQVLRDRAKPSRGSIEHQKLKADLGGVAPAEDHPLYHEYLRLTDPKPMGRPVAPEVERGERPRAGTTEYNEWWRKNTDAGQAMYEQQKARQVQQYHDGPYASGARRRADQRARLEEDGRAMKMLDRIEDMKSRGQTFSPEQERAMVDRARRLSSVGDRFSVVTNMYDPPERFDPLGHSRLGSGDDFSLWYQRDPEESAHHITATSSDNGIVGHFYWGDQDGRILGVHVHPSFQRRGLATMMHNSAKALSSSSGFVDPVHSDNQTPDGEAWARYVTGATKAKPKPKPPRKPEEVWYDVHKHPEGVPGGMGKSPEHHLRNRGWRGHEINEGSGKKTIQYRHQDYPNFVISYGGGSGTKPDHNFRILHMGINSNVPKVTRAYSVAEAMNTVERLHGLNNGLVVQPMTHDSAVAQPLGPSEIPDVPQIPDAPHRDMDVADNYPDFPSQPTHTERWRNPNRNFELRQIPDPPNWRSSSWEEVSPAHSLSSVRETGVNWEDE